MHRQRRHKHTDRLWPDSVKFADFLATVARQIRQVVNARRLQRTFRRSSQATRQFKRCHPAFSICRRVICHGEPVAAQIKAEIGLIGHLRAAGPHRAASL